MISINNLSKTFAGAKTVHALNGVNLHIKKGDIFGIIGMSGAGKSTLLRCISNLEKPTNGQILIENKDIFAINEKELIKHRKQVGVIFQGYNLLMQKSIYKNIAFPLEISGMKKDAIEKRVTELLEIVGLNEKRNSYPSELSGGQCQRVAIARALAVNPKVLLCDEPTSALDAFTTKSILKLLNDINQNLGVTIVIITHEIGVVKSICNKVAVIEMGKIVEDGLTSEILKNPTATTTKQLLGIDD